MSRSPADVFDDITAAIDAIQAHLQFGPASTRLPNFQDPAAGHGPEDPTMVVTALYDPGQDLGERLLAAQFYH